MSCYLPHIRTHLEIHEASGADPGQRSSSSSRAGGLILGVDVYGAGAGAEIAGKMCLWQGSGRWSLNGLGWIELALEIDGRRTVANVDTLR